VERGIERFSHALRTLVNKNYVFEEQYTRVGFTYGFYPQDRLTLYWNIGEKLR
jgi:hypothetical protein